MTVENTDSFDALGIKTEGEMAAEKAAETASGGEGGTEEQDKGEESSDKSGDESGTDEGGSSSTGNENDDKSGDDKSKDDKGGSDDDSAGKKDKGDKGLKSPWGKPGEVPKGVQERFKTMSIRNQNLDAELTKTKSQVTQLEATVQKLLKAATPEKITREHFDSDEAYMDYMIKKGVQDGLSEHQKNSSAQDLQKKESDKIAQTFEKNYESAKAELTDYDDVVSASTVQLHPETVKHLALDELGPYAIYTVAKSPELQKEINNMSAQGRHNKMLEILKGVAEYKAALAAGQKSDDSKGDDDKGDKGGDNKADDKADGDQKPERGGPDSLPKGKVKSKLDPSKADPMKWIEEENAKG